MAFQANAFQNDAFQVVPTKPKRPHPPSNYSGVSGFGGGGGAGASFPLWVAPPASPHPGDHAIADAAFRAGRLLQDKMRAAALVGAMLSEEAPEMYAAAALGALIEDAE